MLGSSTDQAIKTISARRPDGKLLEDDLDEVGGKTTAFTKVVDRLLTGPEIKLPED
ncbi:hypothetical protein AB9K35_08495 [Leisingera sp. XS_AS12]|uniref:hypothetical protein n=1 Tax=Leisingera sp. XS_AS12 TaxID=3241294 RepID=UPI00351105C1